MQIVVMSSNKVNLVQEREEIPFILVQNEPLRIYGNPQHGEIIVQHNGEGESTMYVCIQISCTGYELFHESIVILSMDF